MDREINLDSILALEKRIRDRESALIQLKRARNSLLNISILLPPEILGSIFYWNVIPDGDRFARPANDSFNFLLVCHHWYEVALRTPELWTSWGNSIPDWKKRYARCRNTPLDLVLRGFVNRTDLDDGLREALQDRAARDTIRRVHLSGTDAELLDSVISSIVTEGEETQLSDVRSFVIENNDRVTVDISAFFSRYRIPKLQYLRLFGCNISSWDLLESRITSLTTLSLPTSGLSDISGLSPTPTLPQLLSILSANPNLECLVLSEDSVPYPDGDRASPRVQMRHLKELNLSSDYHCVFGLLNRLELPNKMSDITLSLSECPLQDLPQTLGSYLGDRVRRRGRSPSGLGLMAYPGSSYFYLQAGDAHEADDFPLVEWFITVDGTLNTDLEREDADKLFFDIIGRIPWEEVTNLTTTLPILHSELCFQMRNLTCLRLEAVDLPLWFAEPYICEPHEFESLLSKLVSISINEISLGGGDWSPLTNFLARRAAVGKPISLLRLGGYLEMGDDVVESIQRVVKVFEGEVDEDE